MGLDIGGDVFVSFISNDQEANVYRELLIASASLQELDSAPKSIAIPDELMENAGIMPDADIQIICGQGVILITAQASMSTSERCSKAFISNTLFEAAKRSALPPLFCYTLFLPITFLIRA